MNPNANQERYVEAAIAAVQAGLRCAMELAQKEVDVTVKSGVDIVTAADVAAEDAMRHVLNARCAELPIVGEERGGEAEGDAYWLLDPICGTRNYASGLPLYACNLAVVQRGVATVGVVGDGCTGQVFAGIRGRGAFNASQPGRPALLVRSAGIVALDLTGKPPFDSPRAAGNLFASLCGDGRFHVRFLGTTLPFAKVACGDFAAAMLIGGVVDPLHIAAGVALAEAAGARVTDAYGKAWDLRSPSCVAAATPSLHEHLLKLIQGAFGGP